MAETISAAAIVSIASLALAAVALIALAIAYLRLQYQSWMITNSRRKEKKRQLDQIFNGRSYRLSDWSIVTVDRMQLVKDPSDGMPLSRAPSFKQPDGVIDDAEPAERKSNEKSTEGEHRLDRSSSNFSTLIDGILPRLENRQKSGQSNSKLRETSQNPLKYYEPSSLSTNAGAIAEPEFPFRSNKGFNGSSQSSHPLPSYRPRDRPLDYRPCTAEPSRHSEFIVSSRPVTEVEELDKASGKVIVRRQFTPSEVIMAQLAYQNSLIQTDADHQTVRSTKSLKFLERFI